MIPQTAEPSPRVQKIAGDVGKMVPDLLQQACEAARSTNKCDSVYVTSLGLATGLSFLSSLLGRCAPGRDTNQPQNYINETSTLLAALLIARMGSVSADGTFAGEFGPHIMATAIADVEKLIGKSPDDQLDQKMIEMTREIMNESGGTLTAFMEARKMQGTAPGTDKIQ